MSKGTQRPGITQEKLKKVKEVKRKIRTGRIILIIACLVILGFAAITYYLCGTRNSIDADILNGQESLAGIYLSLSLGGIAAVVSRSTIFKAIRPDKLVLILGCLTVICSITVFYIQLFNPNVSNIKIINYFTLGLLSLAINLMFGAVSTALDIEDDKTKKLIRKIKGK